MKRRMRVLVVNTNRCRQPVAVLPFGACLVAQAAEDAGHDVRFLDLMFARRPIHALRAAVAGYEPHAVGLSVRNIDTNDVGNPRALVDEVAQMVRTVRSVSTAPVILGGPAVGVMPEAILRHTEAELAAAGDGEVVFPELLAALEAGDDPAAVEGVLARYNGHARDRRPSRRCPLSQCTVRQFGRWVDVRAYRSRMASFPLQSKRGCPFSCIYCTYNLAEGSDYRLACPDEVIASVHRLADQGLRDLEFVDNVFNSPYEHAMAICEGLAAKRPKVRLQSLEINPMFLDGALLEAMRRAGFVGFGVTAESANDDVLASLGKGFTAADVRRAADQIARQPLPCLWIFLAGGPGETPDSLRQTLEFCRRHVRATDAAFINVGVRIYPGTELEALARRQGLLSIAPEEMLAPVFYISSHTPLPWLQGELAEAASGQPNLIVGDMLALPLLQGVLRLSHRLGVRPPLWRHTAKVRRVLQFLRIHP